MRMRFGLVRLFAAFLLICTPALISVSAASDAQAKSTKASASKASISKSDRKARKTPAAKYNPPVYSAIVVDYATGQVLNEVNADVKSYPASLTKMMTLYMLFEALERGDVNMATQIPVSKRAAAAAPSKLYLSPKSTITVQQAIGALITKSANDVAVATGERLGGSEDVFAQKMTAKARALGMTQTTFRNASGLPNPEQFSTARDMATLASHLIKDFPQHYANFSRMEYTYQGQTIRTHNRLLEFYEGADGIKTGFTAASGFNLVASATRNGYRVIGVMFGGSTARVRDQRLASLRDGGFSALSGTPAAPLIARNDPPVADRIGSQIALSDTEDQAESTAEQGDTDEPFEPVTRTGAIETESLAPPAPSTASPARSKPRVVAALVPNTIPKSRAAAPAVNAAGVATWGIQIGAYANRATAETQAAAAALKLNTTFASAGPSVIEATVNGRKMYRARIVGMEKADLMRACALIQSKAGCQAIPPAQVAAR